LSGLQILLDPLLLGAARHRRAEWPHAAGPTVRACVRRAAV